MRGAFDEGGGGLAGHSLEEGVKVVRGGEVQRICRLGGGISLAHKSYRLGTAEA